MTDKELEKLKSLPVPEPRTAAKAAALAAAMAAFDAAATETGAQSAATSSEEKNPQAPQGSAEVVRLIHASQPKRRPSMRARHGLYATAASIAVLMLGAGSAIYYTYDQRMESSGVVGMSDSAAPSRMASNDAPAVSPVAPAAAPQPAPEQVADGSVGFTGKPTTVFEEGRFSPKLPAESERRAESSVKAPEGQLQGGLSEAKKDASGGGVAAPTAEEDGAADMAAAPAAPPAPSIAMRMRKPAGAEVTLGNAKPKIAEQMEPLPQLSVFDDDKFRDKFEAVAINPVKQVATEPVSTFSIDVDTASYAVMRRALNSGRLPPKDSVRVEEMINYFPYAYPTPEKAETPFQSTVTVTPAPWNPANKLLHIGIKGYELRSAERPRANLVFLIDVSGSMASPDKLELLKNAFRMLVDELKPDDTVGIVTYAGSSGVALEPTKISDKRKILRAIEGLGAGGSTAGAEGINAAYQLAEANFDKTGVNRVILATDGDFNVGITNEDELKGFIERKRASGVFLSILGVGEGNYNDALMQSLAQNGNGTAAYVDTLNEARKVLVDEASSSLFTIAKDVKIQVEFNPAAVSEYRLIGYETRALKREDFNNDKVDAGDIGSGHTVTAIYEMTPVGAPKLMDDLRYAKPEVKAGDKPAADTIKPAEAKATDEYAFLKLRYKLPKEDTSNLVTVPVTKAMERAEIGAAPEDVRFSVAVAAFGQLLRGQPYLKSYNYDDVLALGRTARGTDNFGYRAEFLNLVRLAKSARQ